MENVDQNPKENGVTNIWQALQDIEKNRKPIPRLEKAKILATNVANYSRNLDQAVAKLGEFFEDLLDTELLDERMSKILEDRGYLDPKDNPIGIPNSLTEHNSELFDKATQEIIHAPDSELRNHAMFLISLCSSLMFERGLVDKELEIARDGRRKAILEIMKIQEKFNQRTSPHPKSLRF